MNDNDPTYQDPEEASLLYAIVGIFLLLSGVCLFIFIASLFMGNE